jgi:hypothetical protein
MTPLFSCLLFIASVVGLGAQELMPKASTSGFVASAPDHARGNYVDQPSQFVDAYLAKAEKPASDSTDMPAGDETITMKTEDTGGALVNPAMGWTMHFYSNVPANYGSKLAPADTLDDFPGLSTVYLRLPWAYLEPEEGKYNWAILDTPAQCWIAKGKRIALRLTTSENWMKYATPEWVKNAGAKGTFYEFNKGRVADESLDMRSLKVGPPAESPITRLESEFAIGLVAPTTKPGNHELFISVGLRDGTPRIALPLGADDGQRRYKLGTIYLQSPANP